MGNISLEQKLELVRSIRMQHEHNRNQCRERERFLYGCSSSGSIAGYETYNAKQTDSSMFKSFRIRFLIAILLMGLFIFMDKSGSTVFPISTDELSTYLSDSAKIRETFNSFAL